MAASCCCGMSACMDGVEKRNCGDCRTWEEELYWNRFHSFYFCQNLSCVRDFHKQLAIPKKFAENARAVLPSKVTLRGPSRASWCAVMTKKEEDLFFTDGWEEFVNAYSLQANDILVFKFDGVSTFDILIFDGENLCEKESAYFVKKCGRLNAENPKKRTSTEADIEEHDDDGLIHRATKQPREEVIVVNDNDTPKRSKYSQFYSRMRKKRLHKAMSSKASLRKRTPPAENGLSNVQSEPSNNEPLITEMNGSCATEAPNQNSPPETNGSLSTKTPPQDTPHINGVILPEATPQKVARARGRPRKRSGASSSKFASSVGRQRKKLDSSKAGEDTPPRSPRYVSKEGKLALEVARKQMNEDGFLVMMRATTVCKRFILTIPPAWCKKHLPPKSQDVFFRFGEKTFLARLSYSPQKTVGQICGGWKQVVLANELKMYDVCVFNIASMKEDALMLDVNVFRAGLPTDEPSSPVIVVD